jgi:hypothetical protein
MRDMVTVILPSGKELILHTRFLIKKSAYFKAALQDRFTEGRTREVRLEENVRTRTFALVVQWIYSEEFQPEEQDGWTKEMYRWSTLFDAWLLADYLGMPTLQNRLVDDIIGQALKPSAKDGGISVFDDFFELTNKESPIRKLLVALKARSATHKKVADSQPLIMEVFEKVAENRDKLAHAARSRASTGDIDILCAAPKAKDFYVADPGVKS